MSQEVQHNTNQIQNDSQTQDWGNILKELQKIDSLRKSVIENSFKIDNIEQEVDFIKKIQDIDDQSKSKSDKEDNVIDDKKSQAVLSSNEKKRYQNIGEQFVKGAGKQFQKIKKAIQFKQKMKTSNDKFIQEVKKGKEISKKQTEKNGFWKKLLAVVAVLGVVAILFRDKIAKLLPDLSNGMEGFGNNIINIFGGLIKTLSSSAIGFMGKNLVGVIRHVCIDILPNIIRSFFSDTLPIAMLTSTLAIMSIFSESAGEQLEKLIGQRATDKAHATEGAAERQLEIANAVSILGTSVQQMQQKQGQLQAAQNNYAEALYLDDKNGNDKTKSIVGELDEVLSGYNLDSMIRGKDESGRILSLTSLLHQIADINEKEPDLKKRRQLYAAAIEAHVGKLNDTDRENLLNFLTQKVTAESDIMSVLAQTMFNDTNYQSIVSAIRERQNFTQVGNDSPQVETVTSPVNFVTNINVSQVIATHVADSINGVLISIDNFLNGKQQNTSFLDAVTSYFIQLKNSSVEHFKIITQRVFTTIEKLNDVFKFMNFLTSYDGKTQPTIAPTNFVNFGQFTHDGWDDNSMPTNYLIMNLNMQETYATAIGSSLKVISESTIKISSVVDSSITALNEINSKLNSQIIIQRKEVQISGIDSIVDNVAKNTQAIQNLKKTKMDKPQGDTGGNGKPPRGTQTGS